MDWLERGLLVPVTGDIMALSPPLVLERGHIDEIRSLLGAAIGRLG